MYKTNARKPSYDVLLKAANYFNVSTDYFLGRVSEPMNYLFPEIGDMIKDAKSGECLEKVKASEFYSLLSYDILTFSPWLKPGDSKTHDSMP